MRIFISKQSLVDLVYVNGTNSKGHIAPNKLCKKK